MGERVKVVVVDQERSVFEDLDRIVRASVPENERPSLEWFHNSAEIKKAEPWNLMLANFYPQTQNHAERTNSLKEIASSVQRQMVDAKNKPVFRIILGSPYIAINFLINKELRSLLAPLARNPGVFEIRSARILELDKLASSLVKEVRDVEEILSKYNPPENTKAKGGEYQIPNQTWKVYEDYLSPNPAVMKIDFETLKEEAIKKMTKGSNIP